MCTWIYVLSYFLSRVIPESIRWHVTQGNSRKALKIAAKISRVNKIELPEDLEVHAKASFSGKKPSDYNVFDLFKTPIIRKRAFLMFYIW